MYAPPGIHSIDMELTTRCNARCPMCSRNLAGGRDNPNLRLTELTYDDILQIFPPTFVRQLTSIVLCGVYGDPSNVTDVVQSLRYLRTLNERMMIQFHSNGGARTPDFWADLARTVTSCIFAIDGLEDTNALYRRGTIWSNVMRNAKAFIDAGGNAEWTFIIFKHNEHQIDEAAALARDLGFSRFTVKKSHRFFQKGKLVDRFAVRGMNGEVEYEIEPPSATELLNEAGREISVFVSDEQASYQGYLDQTPIDCRAVQQKRAYISAEGLVLPCCFMANLYPARQSSDAQQLHALIAGLPGGRDAIDARLHHVNDIVAGPLFRHIEDSWTLPSVASGRFECCARTCGRYDFEAYQKTASLI